MTCTQVAILLAVPLGARRAQVETLLRRLSQAFRGALTKCGPARLWTSGRLWLSLLLYTS